MRGLILASDETVSGLARIAAPSAAVRIVLNTRIFADPVPVEVRGLPDLTPDYVRDVLSPGYVRRGIRITAARELDPGELLNLGTSWARRLSHRQPPPSIVVEGIRDAG